MITVTLSYPDGQQEEVLLAVIPRKGELIRPNNGPSGSAPLVVEYVMHMEGHADPPNPKVIVGVRLRAEGPPT